MSVEIETIRRLNALYFADKKMNRATLAKKLGYDDTNYLNQLLGNHLNIGSRTARKFEKALNLEPGWMDAVHPDLWGSSQEEVTDYIMQILPTLTSADLSRFVEGALKIISNRKE